MNSVNTPTSLSTLIAPRCCLVTTSYGGLLFDPLAGFDVPAGQFGTGLIGLPLEFGVGVLQIGTALSTVAAIYLSRQPVAPAPPNFSLSPIAADSSPLFDHGRSGVDR
jgi:hypothetical protein